MAFLFPQQVESQLRDEEKSAIEAINRDTEYMEQQEKRFEADTRTLNQKVTMVEKEVARDIKEIERRPKNY